jgi:hypothetical protein
VDEVDHPACANSQGAGDDDFRINKRGRGADLLDPLVGGGKHRARIPSSWKRKVQ